MNWLEQTLQEILYADMDGKRSITLSEFPTNALDQLDSIPELEGYKFCFYDEYTLKISL